MSEPSPASQAARSSSGEVRRSRADSASNAKIIGRYALYDEFASGGMASLHFGRLYGSAGFARTVAIKRLHANLAGQPEFVSMLVDEARLAARIRHPNVVPTLDVVSSDGELLLVMEYVHGMSLAQLLSTAGQQKSPCPVPVAMAIACDMLRGLHAAHEAKSETGVALELVHRDVSPQNVLVGADGITRVVDFGVAKAAGRIQETRDGELKGKVPYMAPEQLRGEPASRRSDVYGAGVVLWESLTGRRLFRGDNDASVWLRVLNDTVKAPSAFVRGIPADLDEIVLRAVAKDPARRFATAIEMAKAIEAVCPLATPLEVGAWVETLGQGDLTHRAELLARVEHAAAPSEPAVGELVASAPLSEPGRSRRQLLGWAGVALAMLLAFGLTGVAIRSWGGAPVAEATASTVSTATAPPAGATSVTGADTAQRGVAVVPTIAPPPPPTESVELDPPIPDKPKKRNTGIKGGGRPTEQPRDPNAGSTAKPSCDPPFITDSAGHKKYKENCL